MKTLCLFYILAAIFHAAAQKIALSVVPPAVVMEGLTVSMTVDVYNISVPCATVVPKHNDNGELEHHQQGRGKCIPVFMHVHGPHRNLLLAMFVGG